MAIIYFILIMCIIVLVHEVGHLVTAKIFGVYCYEFSIGMGPKIWSRKGKETVYSIRAFPIGGFVQMAGENDGEQELYPDLDIPKERTLPGLHPWKRIVILFAGAFMNLMLAWILISGVLISIGRYPSPTEPIIASIQENSAAADIGMQVGDEITKVVFADGTVINPDTFDDFSVFTQSYKDEVTFTVLRNGEVLEFTTKLQEQDGVYLLGITSNPTEYKDVNFLNGFKYGSDYLMDMTKTLFQSLSRLIQGNGLDQLSGPIGIYQATEQQIQYGFVNIVAFLSMLSLNLGIFNLLPVPALDGGRIVLVFIEWLTGKPINRKIEMALIAGSMALLLLMIVLVTGQDVLKLF
ncbi:MAG: RIP metalloprotease RseP [Anaerorhabdus sp.]